MKNTKICSKCKKRKKLFEFAKSNKIKSGYLAICKSCKILLNKKYVYKKCKNCGKKLSDNRHIYCSNCFQLGTLNHNYKDGRTNKKHFCKKCGCGITYNAKTKLCLKCFGKHVHSKNFRGKKNPMYGKSACWKRIQYQNIFLRSTWEANFAKWCDLSGIKWEYEPKTFDLGDTTYTPDFYLPAFDCYIEIKGWKRLAFLQKIKIFKNTYKQIFLYIFDEKILKNVGII